MNLFRAFMELDEAYGVDRQTLINNIKAAGKNYNFDKYTTEQLYRMWERIKQRPKTKQPEAPKHELDIDFDLPEYTYCDCGARLTDAGFCPVCDDGEEDLAEELLEWLDSSGKRISLSTPSASAQTASNTQVKTTTGKYKVAIVSDHGRLRAMADDGIHGLAYVAFPNNLRQFEGQHYEVDQLIWNGKNYRVAGNIEEV